MNCITPGFPVYHQLPELTQTHVHQVSNAIQKSHPAISFLTCLQSLPASGSFLVSQFFTSGGQSIKVSASASVLPMNVQDCISFRTDCFDLLAVQGTLNSPLQYHSSKASILWGSALFIVQLSHPYMVLEKP